MGRHSSRGGDDQLPIPRALVGAPRGVRVPPPSASRPPVLPASVRAQERGGGYRVHSMGRKPSARKIARRVLLFVVPAFIIGYAVVSANDDGYSSYGHGSARTLMPKPPPPGTRC